MDKALYMVFDVESAGLHGEGFAAAWVIVRAEPPGRYELLADAIAVAQPTDLIPDWVRENVLPVLPPATHATSLTLRREFWRVWSYWRRQGAILAADVNWPVEARFLTACVDDDRRCREIDAPYPLLDIASVRRGAGLDPLAEQPRTEFEMPPHNPLADARQSARLLMEALGYGE